MTTFIAHQLRSLFSLYHFLTIFVYISFSWFLAQPILDPSAVYSSSKLTSYYDAILMSLGILSFLLTVLGHFRNALQRGRRELLAVRLSNNQIFWGLVTSYIIFFLIGFSIPVYGAALIQQWLYAPDNVTYSVFLLKITAGFTGYVLFWLVATLALLTKLRNDFTVLVIFVVAYGALFILQFLFDGLAFDHFWLLSIWQGTKASWRTIVGCSVAWLGNLSVAFFMGNSLAKRLQQVELVEPFKKGLFVRFAERLGLHLSMHHLKMMGFHNQKILTLFALVGLAFTLVLLTNPRGDLIVFGKLYLGALLPILFSFNQYYIIQLDRDAGMVHNNFLRAMSYPHIVFHRWALLLVPQILLALSFSLLVMIITGKLSIAFIAYLLFLNIFCSLFNLVFSVLTQSSGPANVMLLLFIYVQLRQDVQDVFASLPLLNTFNLFYPLLQEQNVVPNFLWIMMIVCIGTIMFLILRSLRRVRYYDLATV
ncbi:MAG: hypothetical protein KKB77_08210 [Bacteroidetes bacterium]|nr:hypothetical protein [Bacteroidota bacterium]